MTSFEHVLRQANGHLDLDQWGAPQTKFKLLEVKASAKPRDNVCLSHAYEKTSAWKSCGENMKEDIVHKTVTKWAFSKSGRKYGVDLTSDTFKASAHLKLMEGDWKVNGQGVMENKYAKAEWKAKCLLDCSSPVLAEKLRVFTNVDIEMNHKSENILIMKQNLHWDKYHLGWAFENKDGNFVKSFVQFVNNYEGKSQYWLRANLHDESVSGGCKIDHGSFSHSYELDFGFGEKSATAGFQGSPAVLIAGGDYELNDKTNVDYTMTVGEGISYNQTVEHELSDRLKLRLLQEFDSSNLESKEPAYKLGFGFDYKL